MTLKMNTYKITVKPDRFSGYAPEDWLIALKSTDRDANVADFGFDNGNTVWEVNSSEDLSSLARVRGVVSVELQA